MPSLRKNLASIYAVNIFNGVMGVALVPLSLKFLGVEGYGLFSIYTVIASFVALLDFGIGKSLQRALSADQEKEATDQSVSVACGAYLLILTGVAVVLPALLVLVPKYLFPVDQSVAGSLRWIVFFACIEYVLFIPLAISQSICFASEAFGKHARFSLVSGMARYAILFAAIYLFNSVVAVVGIYVMRRLLDQYLAKKILGPLPTAMWRPIFKISELKELSGHAMGLSVTRLLQTILMSIGSVLVNRFSGLEGLGFYRAAFDLASKVWFISNGIGLVIYPRLVKVFASKNPEQKIFSKLRASMLVSWLGFTVVGLIASVLSPILLPLLKIESKDVISLFMPLVIGICINAHANLGYEVIQATGRYRVLNTLSVMAILVMTVLFFALEPSLGLMSIAWAWMLSQFIYAMSTDLAALTSMNLSKNGQVRSIGIRALSIFLSLVCMAMLQSKDFWLIFIAAFLIQIFFLFLSIFMLRKSFEPVHA